jgi:hypothetical protein
MKDPSSREYKASPELAPVNPALVPSGDDRDANISSIYLVDRRQAAKALLNELRFLSMTPDLAKVDIDAKETDPATRALILQAIKETAGATNTHGATFLQVISTWNSRHFLPSPVLYTKPDRHESDRLPKQSGSVCEDDITIETSALTVRFAVDTDRGTSPIASVVTPRASADTTSPTPTAG